MKKMNKKGFTLAELLIVLAILAILIAIAIPVFTAQLENAKLQADHANLRSAYAIVQTANILGYKNVEGFESAEETAFTGAVYCTDGKFKAADAGTPVTIQSNKHDATEAGSSCAACVVKCDDFNVSGSVSSANAAKIGVTKNADGTYSLAKK